MMRSEDAETVDTTLESLFRSLDTTRFSPYIVFRYYVQLQRFKEAVEFLWRSGSVHMKIDALHLGLAMSSVSGERAALSVGDAEKLRGLRLEVLPKMTESYVAEFCLPDKEMAALYLSTEDSSALNKYAILFDSSPDYQTIISLLTKTHSRCCITNKNSCANTVTTMPGTLRRELLSVARSFEERGKHLKAAYLYHSMGAQAEAVRVLCSLLGGGIVQGPSNSPERAALLKFAGPLAEKTSNATLTALIKVAAFFDAYGARDWAKALGILEGLDLLPVAPPFKCEECARRVGAVAPPELQRCIPALMEAAMVCFRESWAKLKRSGLSSEKVATLAKTAAVEADARRLAKKAAAIVTFSALLPIVVPPETCAFIVKVQAEMS